MPVIENISSDYQSLNFKGKIRSNKRKLSIKQYKNFYSYNSNQYKKGYISPKEYFENEYKLLKRFIPKNYSLQTYFNLKPGIKSMKNTISELIEFIKSQ